LAQGQAQPLQSRSRAEADMNVGQGCHNRRGRARLRPLNRRRALKPGSALL
jgi:hypothetical protein